MLFLPYRLFFTKQTIYKQIEIRPTFKSRVVVKVEKRRTDQNKQEYNNFVRQSDSRRHIEGKPPSNIHCAFKPRRFQGKRNPFLPPKFEL